MNLMEVNDPSKGSGGESAGTPEKKHLIAISFGLFLVVIESKNFID